MVDFDKSHKHMGWNGQDSLQCNETTKSLGTKHQGI